MKDYECITCKHFLLCQGKPSPAPCVNFESRKEEEDAKEKRETKP